MTPDAIIRFYSEQDPDACGRKIEEVWRWDHARLEVIHDYIQWLFPLREKSRFNPNAPVLTQETIDAFRRSATLQMRLRRSLILMLGFYGLQLSELTNGTVHISRAQDFTTKSHNWLTRGNHNHLRLTRMIGSTKMLGLEACSFALFKCLAQIYEDYPEPISEETYRHWKSAAPANDSYTLKSNNDY